MVRECPKPTKIKLDKKTNVETKSVTRRYIPVNLNFKKYSFEIGSNEFERLGNGWNIVQFGHEIGNRRVRKTSYVRTWRSQIHKAIQRTGFEVVGIQGYGYSQTVHVHKTRSLFVPGREGNKKIAIFFILYRMVG